MIPGNLIFHQALKIETGQKRFRIDAMATDNGGIDSYEYSIGSSRW